MNLDFLPKHILEAIKSIGLNNVNEIRLRENFPIKLIANGQSVYLTKTGGKEKIICLRSDIEHVILVVTEKSLYAYNDRIKEGYLTTKDGVRIGIAGECVFNNGQIVTIKNFSSLNVRIPRHIKGCSNKIFQNIISENDLFNTLIICTAGYGKTTILKDLILNVNEKFDFSLLVIDERGEFNQVNGENVDKIAYSDKFYAFNCAVRSMSPNVIVCDELVSENDWACVKNIVDCGVKIVASCHASNLEQLTSKSVFINNLFERYVFLNSFGAPGQINMILDREFNRIL